MENRNSTLKTKITTGVAAQKVQGPTLRPRAALGELTNAAAVSSHKVKSEHPEEKIEKPAIGVVARKPLHSTKYLYDTLKIVFICSSHFLILIV